MSDIPSPPEQGTITAHHPKINTELFNRYEIRKLFWKGDLRHLDPPKLLVIGTKKPTQEGRKIAYEIGRLGSSKGYSIISGCAPGIDAAAHLGALDHSGSTIAILPSGLDIASYTQTEELQRRIESSGLCLSEYDFNQPANQESRIARDRIQAAVAHIVILVESELDGGAMKTVEYAKQMNKKIYVVKFSEANDVRKGNETLLMDKKIKPMGASGLDASLEYMLK